MTWAKTSCRHSAAFSTVLGKRSHCSPPRTFRVMASSEDIKTFPQKDSRRFLHAVYRVISPELKAHFGGAATYTGNNHSATCACIASRQFAHAGHQC